MKNFEKFDNQNEAWKAFKEFCKNDNSRSITLKNFERFISPDEALFRFVDFCRTHNSCAECKYKPVQQRQEHLGNHLGNFVCCIYWLFDETTEGKKDAKQGQV